MIAIDKIEKSYGKAQILNDICCEFPKGKVTAIVGENGSGKSTLLSILGKYLNPNDGGVFIDAIHYTEFSRQVYAQKVATLRQSNSVQAKITVKEFVSYARYPHTKNKLSNQDYAIVDECLKLLSCDQYADKYLHELSGGQVQRALLAAIFAQDTPIILLDEPLNNLDLKHSHELMRIIKSYAELKNKTIVVIMHDINMVYQYANYALALKDGKIVHCGPINTFKDTSVLKAIYDLKFGLFEMNNQCVAFLQEENL